MQVLILNGSPIKGGNTDSLCESFKQGAIESGHGVEKIYLNDLHIEPYRGGENTPYSDQMKIVFEGIKKSHILVIASPLYWMSFSAQIKIIMDRLSITFKDDLSHKKSALLVAGASPQNDLEATILPYYKLCFITSLGWEDLGCVLAGGVFAPGDVKNTSYLKQAYELGKSLS